MFCMIFVVIKFWNKTVFRIDDKARTMLKTLMLLQDFLLKECGADAFGSIVWVKSWSGMHLILVL